MDSLVIKIKNEEDVCWVLHSSPFFNVDTAQFVHVFGLSIIDLG